jgi:tetratricopeptide (TPR) repeat protein
MTKTTRNIIHTKTWGNAIKLAAGMLVLLLGVTGCGASTAEQISTYKEAGIEAMSAENYKEAVEQFDAALQLSGGQVTEEMVDICFYKAAAQFNLGNITDAIDIYTAIMEYDEENSEAAFLRGSVYLEQGELDKALADYHTALERSKDDSDMYLLIGENLEASGYEQEARAILEQGLDAIGDDSNGLVGCGRIYLALGETDKAIDLLEQAAEKNLSEAKMYLAQAYEQAGDSEKASELLTEYAQEDNPSSEVLAMLGNMAIKNGDYEEALTFFQQGLESKKITNEQELRKGEIAALEYTGNFTDAKEKMQEYLQLYPKDADALREQVFLETR